MARNGSGTFTREGGATAWVDDRNAGTKIRADLHDTHDQDIADAITASLAKDGQTTTTARIPFAFGIGLADGTAAAPALNFSSDTNTGIYRYGADQVGVSTAGAVSLVVANGALFLTKTSDDATGTSLNTTHDSATPAASDVIFSTTHQSDDSAGNVTIYAQTEVQIVDTTNGSEDGLWGVRTMRAGTLTSTLVVDTAVRTATDGATNLGTSSIGWGDLFLAATKKIDFGAGDAAITHSANFLTVTGATWAVSGELTATGNFAINTTAFAVTASSGNTTVGGTLDVTSNFTVATTAFTANASTGAVSCGTITPITNDTYALGSTSLQYTGVHLSATGEVRWRSGANGLNKGATISQSLADDASVTLPLTQGMVFILDSEGRSAIYGLRGGSNATEEISDLSSTYVNADTDTNHCVFHNGSEYVLKNRRGGARSYRISYIEYV